MRITVALVLSLALLAVAPAAPDAAPVGMACSGIAVASDGEACPACGTCCVEEASAERPTPATAAYPMPDVAPPSARPLGTVGTASEPAIPCAPVFASAPTLRGFTPLLC